MELRVLGCGDAFGSGGRLQTSYLVEGAPNGDAFLLDCGATTMIALTKADIDPNAISTIYISHLHGDHFSGLVWFFLHAQHRAQRSKPLTVIGPEGVRDRVLQTAELLFPGMTETAFRFDLEFVEFGLGSAGTHRDIALTTFEALHPSGALSAMLRFQIGEKVLSFSGDTEWRDDLLSCAKDADLFICECYALQAGVRYHLDWETLSARFNDITARKIVLTHMNGAMLAASKTLSHPRVVFAEDEMVLSF
ncbi:MAG: MBL fold metallo-hydrolase [Pseudomonadota bacterium]